MSASFNPPSNTVVHTEFVGTTGRTVSVQNSQAEEFEVLSVTYSHPEGRMYEDMVITNNSSSFTFASKFEYSSKRITKYLIQDKPTAAAKQFLQVDSPHLLPANYKGIYQVGAPPDLITVTFNVVGRARTFSPADPNADPPTSASYGPWFPSTRVWTMDVQMSFEYTAVAIKNAVAQGKGYQDAVRVYPEAQL